MDDSISYSPYVPSHIIHLYIVHVLQLLERARLKVAPRVVLFQPEVEYREKQFSK